MNKAQFIAELRRRISQLPPAEIEKSAAYYEEMIDDRIEDGKTEEQAVAELEDVEVIAERILRETPIHTLVKTKVQPKGGWSAAAIVLAVLGAPLWLPLLAAAACIVLVLYVLVWSVLVTFYRFGTCAHIERGCDFNCLRRAFIHIAPGRSLLVRLRADLHRLRHPPCPRR